MYLGIGLNDVHIVVKTATTITSELMNEKFPPRAMKSQHESKIFGGWT
jgi:hypothetical protein